MVIKPKNSNWTDSFIKRITDLPKETSITLPHNREEVIKFLKWWNTTAWNNACTVDVISYEQLIYYEITYSKDKEIQNLIQILKEKISKLYMLKSQYTDLLVDKKIYEDLNHIRSQMAADAKVYSFLDAGEIQWRPE